MNRFLLLLVSALTLPAAVTLPSSSPSLLFSLSSPSRPMRPSRPARPSDRALRRLELDTARSRIGFEADATMGEFRGTARKLTGWVETAEPDFSDARGVIEIEAASFRTGIGLRDRHLRETIEADKHPLIRFTLDSARTVQSDSAGRQYRLHGALVVRGVTRTVDVQARITQRDDIIVASGRLPIRFTELGMKPPSRLLGTTKVKDAFTITFDCTFGARSAAASPPNRPPG